MNNNPTKKVGLKMQNFSGSWFNDNFSQVYTTHPLQAIPVRCIDVPGPAFIDLEFGSKIETLPALSPLYDAWTFTTKFIFCPYRLYLPKFRINNVEDVGQFDDEYFPRLVYYGKTAPFLRAALNPYNSTNDEYGDLGYDRAVPGGDLNRVTYGSFPAVLRGSLMERLGYQPGELLTGQTFVSESYNVSFSLASSVTTPRPDTTYDWRTDFNIVPVLAYIDSWLYFEFNKQDKTIPVYKENFYFGPGITHSLSYIEYDDLKSLIPSFAYGKKRNTDTNPNLGGNVMHIGLSDDMERMYLRAERGGINELCEGYPLFTNFHSSYGSSNADSGFYVYKLNDDINIDAGPWSPTMLNTPWSYVEGADLTQSLQQYGTLWNYMRNSMSRVGLLPTTLNGDKFTSWFNSESIEKLRTYVIKSNMTFEQLRVSHSDYYMQVLSMVSGNRYTDYLQFVFDSALELKDHPIFVGSDTIRFNFMDVLNQSQGSSGEYNESLGSTGSKGYVGFNKGRPIKFKTREPGMLLCYSILTPIVRYFQGENLFFSKKQFSEVWHPQYRGRGFTNVRRSEVYKSSMGNVSTGANYIHGASLDDDALGFVPIGWEYMNEENRASAGMALEYYKPWSLIRDFNDYLGSTNSYNPIADDDFFNPGWNINNNYYPTARQLMSTYGTDDSFNYNFANVGQDAENFIVKTEFNYSRYIPIGKQLIKPNL